MHLADALNQRDLSPTYPVNPVKSSPFPVPLLSPTPFLPECAAGGLIQIGQLVRRALRPTTEAGGGAGCSRARRAVGEFACKHASALGSASAMRCIAATRHGNPLRGTRNHTEKCLNGVIMPSFQTTMWPRGFRGNAVGERAFFNVGEAASMVFNVKHNSPRLRVKTPPPNPVNPVNPVKSSPFPLPRSPFPRNAWWKPRALSLISIEGISSLYNKETHNGKSG